MAKARRAGKRNTTELQALAGVRTSSAVIRRLKLAAPETGARNKPGDKRPSKIKRCNFIPFIQRSVFDVGCWMFSTVPHACAMALFGSATITSGAMYCSATSRLKASAFK